MKEQRESRAARTKLFRGPFARLTWHFFGRLFTGEFATEQRDRGFGIGLILALAALPGAFVSLALMVRYSSFLRWLERLPPIDYDRFSIPDKYMFVAYSMVIAGLVALLEWDSLLPDRQDHDALAPLPLSDSLIFVAKTSALGLFVLLFVAALNSGSTAFFPLQVLGNQPSVAAWFQFTVGHAVATCAGGVFTFLFFVALAGLLIFLLPYHTFRRVSRVVQFLSAMVLVAILMLTPEIESQLASIAQGKLSIWGWLPSIWFLGLYEQISSHGGPVFGSLALRAIMAFVLVAGASLIFYLAGYGRCLRRIRETAEPAAPGPSRVGSWLTETFDRCVLRRPFDCACFHFAGSTLAKSQRHRLILAGIVGLGAALATQDLAGGWPSAMHGQIAFPNAAVLSAPLAFSFLLLAGLRFLFDLPAELPANWIFQIAADGETADARRVARKVMVVALTPVLLLTLFGYWQFWGFGIAASQTMVLLLACMALIEALLVNYVKIPFTSSYPGLKHNFGFVLAEYIVAFFAFSYGLARMEAWGLSEANAIVLLVLISFLAACWVGGRRHGDALAKEAKKLIFLDEAESVVPSMNLR